MARQLAAGNLNLLPASARDGIAGTGGVVVVVATLSHAIVLAEMLDGWAVVTGTVLDHELSEHERETLRQHRFLATNSIVTLQGLASFDLGAARLVVRADSGPGGLPAGAVANNCRSDALMVVDFAARHHALLRQWKRERENAYIEAGFTEAGADSTLARVERFAQEKVTEHVHELTSPLCAG